MNHVRNQVQVIFTITARRISRTLLQRQRHAFFTLFVVTVPILQRFLQDIDERLNRKFTFISQNLEYRAADLVADDLSFSEKIVSDLFTAFGTKRTDMEHR